MKLSARFSWQFFRARYLTTSAWPFAEARCRGVLKIKQMVSTQTKRWNKQMVSTQTKDGTHLRLYAALGTLPGLCSCHSRPLQSCADQPATGQKRTGEGLSSCETAPQRDHGQVAGRQHALPTALEPTRQLQAMKSSRVHSPS